MNVLEVLLHLVGYLATGAVLFLVDRFLDRRLAGPARKIRGPVPFWWVFVSAFALGWGVGMATTDSPHPVWVQVLVLVVLLLSAVSAFCLRFGIRLPR